MSTFSVHGSVGLHSHPHLNHHQQQIQHHQNSPHHSQQQQHQNSNNENNIEQILLYNLEQQFSSDYDSFSSPSNGGDTSLELGMVSPEHFINSEIGESIIELVVLHKPRGSKGLWQRVENADKLRVTKGKGKRLKLQFVLPQNFACENLVNDQNLKIQLLQVDSSPSHPSSQNTNEHDFVFECSKTFNHQLVEIELKLFRIGKQLQFFVQVRSNNGDVMIAKSVEFATHNSGASTAPGGPGVSTTTSSSTSHQTITKQEPIVPPHLEYKDDPQNPVYNHLHMNSQNERSHIPNNSNYNHNQNTNQQSNGHSMIAIDPHAHIESVKKRKADPFENAPYPSYPPQISNTMNSNGFIEPPVTSNTNNATVVPGSLEVYGTVRARAFMQFSDLRLKTNIRDIVDAISIVSQLEGKTYEWKQGTHIEEPTGGKRVIGLIAQEVQKVIPEVVIQDPNTGFLAVSYTEILPILIEAFKEFLGDYNENKVDVQKQLDELSAKLNNLENRPSNEMRITIRDLSNFAKETSRRNSVEMSAGRGPFPKGSEDQKLKEHDQHSKKSFGKESTIPLPPKKHAQICLGIIVAVSLALMIIGIILMATNAPKQESRIVSTNNNSKRSERMVYREKIDFIDEWKSPIREEKRQFELPTFPSLRSMSSSSTSTTLQSTNPIGSSSSSSSISDASVTSDSTSSRPTVTDGISEISKGTVNGPFIGGIILLTLGGVGVVGSGVALCFTLAPYNVHSGSLSTELV